MIKLEKISLYRGHKQLLAKASATIHNGQKVAVIGANGSGKSSFFAMLLGQLTIDSGDLLMPEKASIAHMKQEVGSCDRAAVEYVIDGDAQLRILQQSLLQAEQQQNHQRVALIHAELDAINGYTAHYRAEQLLQGLGFSPSDYTKPVNTFSGGWQIRLNLAQALMCRSDILLLDEPTNHLDLDAIIWLEEWLKRYQGTLLLISHDRDFVDNVVGQVIHFEQQQLHSYSGNYSAYERIRAERLALQQSLYEKQQREIAHLEKFVNRFRAKASKARQAQSRLKTLDKLERIAQAHVDSPFSFDFGNNSRVSNPLLQLQKTDLGYPDKTVLHSVNLNIEPGARIGLLGANGAGKSTLVKTLAGQLSVQSGQKLEGQNLKIGYFAQQHLDALDISATPLLVIQRLSPTVSEQAIRDFLGGFNFIGDQAVATIENFSGGEKARLALAVIAWQSPNLLLLDEPTNHLDIDMRFALTKALQDFDGAVVLVSHDRHLLNSSVDDLWLVSNGEVKPYQQDLSEYSKWLIEQKKAQQAAKVSDGTEHDQQVQEKPVGKSRKEQKREEAAIRSQLRPLKQKVERLEVDIHKTEQSLEALSETLGDASLYEEKNKGKLRQLLDEQSQLKKQQQILEDDWMMAQEELENMTKELS
ncbi:ATP-binding cassette domain-containing protein [Endozoicomonas sp. SM1973]|uniref:Probable ATP-binding protein YheS n=1 Tax=Spartinivicinus marinus TaxID=2994442 RepID=A0A853IGJ4_9GAMM|nr:ATP-binding cassette domain-containing protein [Spartinivicinus marinus]MCX4027118.1 ATP-binding cassette domain-containing protein [Spartinivicinus marinus]NYZ68597.1 ATP-binding cassette domain-containing protein [Spartinivicinus marinus]